MSENRGTGWGSEQDLSFQPRFSSARRQPIVPFSVSEFGNFLPPALECSALHFIPSVKRARCRPRMVAARIRLGAAASLSVARWEHPSFRCSLLEKLVSRITVVEGEPLQGYPAAFLPWVLTATATISAAVAASIYGPAPGPPRPSVRRARESRADRLQPVCRSLSS